MKASPSTQLSANRDVEEARRIVLEQLRRYSVKVYLFGSRARGDARPGSDIDIAVWPQEALPDDLLPSIRDALENSNILYHVDLVNLAGVDDAFRQKVVEEGQLWKD